MHGSPTPTVQDVLGSINGLPYIWGLLLDGLAPEHRHLGVAHVRGTIDRLTAVPQVADHVNPLASADDPEEALEQVAFFAAAASRDLDEPSRTALLDDVTADLHAAGRVIAAAGGGARPCTGRIEAINVSGGGVPKRAIDASPIGPRGLPGDQQNSRKHHGKPMQAVCLYATEVIDALRAEGHPIAAGAAGENLTVSGLDWAAIRPGVRLTAGTAVLEMSAPATPCQKNAQWFVDGDFRRMSHDGHPGWSRWYAWVIEPGEVAVGDPCLVEGGAGA